MRRGDTFSRVGRRLVNDTEAFKDAQARLLQRVGLRAESRFLEVDSVSGEVHVLKSGEGPPLILVPGFGDPAVMWSPLMAHLPGFTLYAVDRPCFGLSGYARHGTKTMRALAVRFLEQVLDALELDRPVFVGNSIGSLWTLWLALDRPERVSAMMHTGCPAFILGSSAPFPMRLLTVRGFGELMMKLSPPSPGQVERFASMVAVDLSDLPELRDVLVAAQRLPGAQAAILELLRAVIRLRGPRPEMVLDEKALSRVGQPVQLIWGGRDPFGSVALGERVAKLIPQAELHAIRSGGHAPWVGHAGEVGDFAAPFLMRQSELN